MFLLFFSASFVLSVILPSSHPLPPAQQNVHHCDVKWCLLLYSHFESPEQEERAPYLLHRRHTSHDIIVSSFSIVFNTLLAVTCPLYQTNGLFRAVSSHLRRGKGDLIDGIKSANILPNRKHWHQGQGCQRVIKNRITSKMNTFPP